MVSRGGRQTGAGAFMGNGERGTGGGVADIAMPSRPESWGQSYLKNAVSGEPLMYGVAPVSILELGGTISSVNLEDGKTPQLSIAEIFKRIGEERSDVWIASPGSRKYWAGPPQESSALTFADIMRVVDRLYYHTEAAKGVVVTCGTDRLADVAKMASLMLRNPLRPIIFTGSQRTVDDVNNDVGKNLRDALFMADKLAPGFYVVFGGRVLNAFDTYKYSTDNLDAFRSSSEKGDLGAVDSAAPSYTINEDRYHLPSERRAWLRRLSDNDNHEETFCDYDHDNRVLSIDMPIGNYTNLIEPLLTGPQIKGVIIRISGAGGINQEAASRLSEAAKYTDGNGMERYKPVVVVTRCASGATDLDVYSSSAGVASQKAIISAGPLSAESASLLLQWGLGGTSEIEDIRKLFKDPLNPICFKNFDRRAILDRDGSVRDPWNYNPFSRKMIFYNYAEPNDPSLRTYD